MNIGIIGAGHIGATAARLLVRAGHQVAISNSRGPETLRALVEELGPNARATTPEEAARFGEVVLTAIPLREYTSLPAEALRGKIVIDANNYYPARDGQIEALDSRQMTSSELIASHLTGARVVKAFNTIWFEHLAKQGSTTKPVAQRRAIFVSGDDAAAMQVVAELIESIGFGTVMTGTLRDSRRQEPDGTVYNKDVTVEEGEKLL